MAGVDRRGFLSQLSRAAGMAAAGTLPASVRQALAIDADRVTGTIADVQHVVILMLENRSFDHYFGTLRGVRGFGDRHPVPLPGGRNVWQQSSGDGDVAPFHLNSETSSALLVATTPHNFDNAQAAWGQGRLDRWARFKTPVSMGHYRRADIPFQFALAEAFTLCDAHHCSVTGGTDPNRITFWSGANFDPARRAAGEDATAATGEPVNLRCWLEGGALPEPGYRYRGTAFTWPTLPELLQAAGISWRIYQDPNDNWQGLMHGCLAFRSFREAQPGSALYENGMRHWSLERFAEDVREGRLPQVSWILPSQSNSEHPAGSSPPQGAEFTARVLDALTANPSVWSRTVFFLSFDENDGLFDHVPPPAPPSFHPDGTAAGKATLDLRGLYFSDPERKYLDPADPASGTRRPWGLGPRVPLYAISPWSRGGWVNSQVFDHTSVGQFLERRFGITVPAISPWHRAVCGDLTSAFDFAQEGQGPAIALPGVAAAERLAGAKEKPAPTAPAKAEPRFQEPGTRPSRALPYALEVVARADAGGLTLSFRNEGKAGAVFHVYDRQRLDAIPRRYTVEAGRALEDVWAAATGAHDLWIQGPNGFLREVKGPAADLARLQVLLRCDPAARTLRFAIANRGSKAGRLDLVANAYGGGPWQLAAAAGGRVEKIVTLPAEHDWYDLTLRAGAAHWRFAGRVETGQHGISDPALGTAG